MAKWSKALFSHSDDTGFKSGWGQNHFSFFLHLLVRKYNFCNQMTYKCKQTKNLVLKIK